MDDAVGERALKKLPQRRLDFIDGSISSYYYIINSPSSSLLSYMLKPSQLLTQGFGKNMTAQEKLFKHMCK